MSQSVGLNFKSKIPTLADDASIEEALRVYHYGVDTYSGQPIPEDSIEGNFSAIDTRLSSVESTISNIPTTYVKLLSATSSPNIITAQSTATVPLTVRAIASQTSSLQSWQNSSSSVVASMSTGGALGIAGYSSIGSTTVSSSIASSINIINSSHKGIVIKAAASQTSNIQEWQDSNSNVLASVAPSGAISSTSVAVTGNQTLDDFRARNIRASTSQPSGGNDGDVWFVYV